MNQVYEDVPVITRKYVTEVGDDRLYCWCQYPPVTTQVTKKNPPSEIDKEFYSWSSYLVKTMGAVFWMEVYDDGLNHLTKPLRGNCLSNRIS